MASSGTSNLLLFFENGRVGFWLIIGVLETYLISLGSPNMDCNNGFCDFHINLLYTTLIAHHFMQLTFSLVSVIHQSAEKAQFIELALFDWGLNTLFIPAPVGLYEKKQRRHYIRHIFPFPSAVNLFNFLKWSVGLKYTTFTFIGH